MDGARGDMAASGAAAREAAPVLLADGISISPDGRRVLLQDVALNVSAGERIALIGPSGSGKTSLLRTLAGQLAPLTGRIEVSGQALTGLTGEPLRRLRGRIALVAQKHDLVDPLATHANVMAGALGRWSNARALRYLIRPRADELQEAEAALQAVGLGAKLRTPTSRLSGGEQQRVAIARALVQAPVLLLADEPVASLDPATAVEVLELLAALARERGMALICSLHQPELAARYFDAVLSVRDGRLERA